jgi:hypothetical protein
VAVPVELLPPITDVGVLVIEDKVAGMTVSVALTVLPRVALIEEVDCEATPRVVTVNVAEVAPAATVTDPGTVATAVLLLCRVTTDPPVGAALLKRTVPVELLPPTTLVGLKDTELIPAVGFTVKLAVTEVPDAAPIVTVVAVVTEAVVTVKVVEVVPAGTVTEAGT